MVPVKKGAGVAMKCRKCGTTLNKATKDTKIVEKVKNNKGVILLEKDEITMPTTEKECPKCQHDKSYYWLQQTRSADEPPTQFFKCEKCNYTWREYK